MNALKPLRNALLAVALVLLLPGLSQAESDEGALIELGEAFQSEIYYARPSPTSAHTAEIYRLDRPETASSPGQFAVVPIASLELSIEQVAALSAGVVFAIDGEARFRLKSENPALVFLSLLTGVIDWSGQGIVLQGEVGIGGAKASVGFFEASGTNILYFIPLSASGYQLKLTYFHTWSSAGHQTLAHQDYLGPEMDVMLNFMKLSFGLLRQVGGPLTPGSRGWLVNFGIGVGF